jgi:hypothetical protein
MTSEYVFIDERDVEAPIERVFDALADARTYPRWWRPVYIAVEADCEPGVGCVHVRFDWRVFADRPLLRYLTPILRPLFRWNHGWSIKRAIEGLEPYARSEGLDPYARPERPRA